MVQPPFLAAPSAWLMLALNLSICVGLTPWASAPHRACGKAPVHANLLAVLQIFMRLATFARAGEVRFLAWRQHFQFGFSNTSPGLQVFGTGSGDLPGTLGLLTVIPELAPRPRGSWGSLYRSRGTGPGSLGTGSGDLENGL